MLLIANRLTDLEFSKLMEVYIEGNQKKADEYGACGLLRAEQEFCDYLRDDFFRQKDAFYAVWIESGKYVSAVRLEPYKDGWLLQALETAPEHRGRGYARVLVSSVLDHLCRQKVYSHVSKGNLASLRTHYACGFEVYFDHAVYLDGSVSHRAFTLCFRSKGK